MHTSYRLNWKRNFVVLQKNEGITREAISSQRPHYAERGGRARIAELAQHLDGWLVVVQRLKASLNLLDGGSNIVRWVGSF